MRSWLKELINIFILVDGLTAVQSPKRTPVNMLDERQSHEGDIRAASGEAASREPRVAWAGE